MSIRGALESMYAGKCTIFVSNTYTENNITRFKREIVCTDTPCRLSYGTTTAGSPSVAEGVTPGISQSITLFINPDITIPSGSEIEISQNGTTQKYKASGVPKMYVTHQEIALELKEEFA